MFRRTGRRARISDRTGRGAARERFAPEPLEPRALLAAVAWDGGGGDGNWHNPLNWDADVLPGEADDVTIAAGPTDVVRIDPGQFARVRSLEVFEQFLVNGELEVTDQTIIGDAHVTFVGEVHTANLTVEAGSQPVAAAGWWDDPGWTISGVSVVRREIGVIGLLTIAEDSTLTFEQGSGGGHGRINSTAGIVEVLAHARIEGLGAAFEQITIARHLRIGDAVSIRAVGIVAAGSELHWWDRPHITMPEQLPATIVESSLDLEWARGRGRADYHDTSIILRPGTYWGEVRMRGGELRVLASMSTQGLDVRDAEIILGDPAIEGLAYLSAWPGTLTIARSNIQVLEPTFLSGDVSDSSISGPHPVHVHGLIGCVFEAGTTLHVRSIRSSAEQDPLVEGLAVRAGGTLIISSQVHWTSGEIVLDTTESELRLGAGRTLVATFPDARVSGPGRVVNSGTLQSITGATLDIQTRITSPGTMKAMGGSINITEDLPQISPAGVLKHGTWWAGPGGTITFSEAVVRNNSTIVVEDDGTIPGLAALVRNYGTITLIGGGDWVDGGTEVNLINKGNITKSGEGTRWLEGSLVQRAQGRIDVAGGRLLLDMPEFVNAGTVSIQNNSEHRPRLRILGDYRQTDDGVLSFTGWMSGPSTGFGRLIADRLILAGVLSANFSGNLGGNAIAVLAVGDRHRAGTFDSSGVNVNNAVGLLQYTPKGFRVRILV